MKTLEKQLSLIGICSMTYTPWGIFIAKTTMLSLARSAYYYSKLNS